MTNDKIGLPALTRKLRNLENCVSKTVIVSDAAGGIMGNRKSDYIQSKKRLYRQSTNRSKSKNITLVS